MYYYLGGASCVDGGFTILEFRLVYRYNRGPSYENITNKYYIQEFLNLY